MIQLKISTGKMAGVTHDIRRFPFHIGRSATAELRMDDAGIFEHHLLLEFDPAQGYILSTQTSAIATVNGWPIQAVILRNGDEIEIGAVKIRFWLGETKQSALRIPGLILWLALAAVTAGQIALLLWLLK